MARVKAQPPWINPVWKRMSAHKKFCVPLSLVSDFNPGHRGFSMYTRLRKKISHQCGEGKNLLEWASDATVAQREGMLQRGRRAAWLGHGGDDMLSPLAAVSSGGHLFPGEFLPFPPLSSSRVRISHARCMCGGDAARWWQVWWGSSAGSHPLAMAPLKHLHCSKGK